MSAQPDTIALVRDTVQVLHVVRDTLAVDHGGGSTHWITASASLLSALAGAAVGQWIARRAGREQHERECAERTLDRAEARTHRRWTSARLARRYLLFSARQLRAIDPRMPNLGQAQIEYWMGNIGDFDEIKARMIELEDDELEESIYQWHQVAMDDLRDLLDLLTLAPEAYLRRHGTNDAYSREIRAEVLRAAFAASAGRAERIANALEPFLAHDERRSAGQ